MPRALNYVSQLNKRQTRAGALHTGMRTGAVFIALPPTLTGNNRFNSG